MDIFELHPVDGRFKMFTLSRHERVDRKKNSELNNVESGRVIQPQKGPLKSAAAVESFFFSSSSRWADAE